MALAGMDVPTANGRTVRVRVCTTDPLPPAKFWILVDPNEDIRSFLERVKDVLHRRNGDVPEVPISHLFCHLDGFEIIGDIGRLVHDNDLVQYVALTNDSVSARVPEEHSSGEAQERQANEQAMERDIMAEANRISLLMRSECGRKKPSKTLGMKRKASVPLAMNTNASSSSVSEALNAFESFKKSRMEATSSIKHSKDQYFPDEECDASSEVDHEDEDDIDEVDEGDGLTLDDDIDDSLVVENALDGTATIKEEDQDSSDQDEDDEDEDEDESDSSTFSSSSSDTTSSSTSASETDSESSSDSSSPEEEPSIPSFSTHEATQWVPPGQGKLRTRRKNQKRREKMRAQQEAQLQDSFMSSEYPNSPSLLPPGGGVLDITPASTAAVPSADTSLESIAKRMLTRTTVGHRKRRSRQAVPNYTTGFVKASDLPVTSREELQKIRVPPPSQIPADEFPEGLTISSTDCEAWYNDQWNGYYDEATQAYLSMQQQIQKEIAEEKRREEDFVMTDQGSNLDGAGNALRDALPLSFGRPMSVQSTLEDENEAPGTDNSDQEKSHEASNSILKRFKAIRSSIYGS